MRRWSSARAHSGRMPGVTSRAASPIRQAGQHGYRGQERASRDNFDAFAGRLHHCAAAEGVHVQHPDAQFRGCAGGLLHGVRDIMKFQVEKDIVAGIHQFLDQGWSAQGEHFFPHLEPALLG